MSQTDDDGPKTEMGSLTISRAALPAMGYYLLPDILYMKTKQNKEKKTSYVVYPRVMLSFLLFAVKSNYL